MSYLFMMMKNKRWIIFLGAVATLLLIPLIAMQFTEEVNWTVTDFLIAGGLLFVTSLGVDLTLRKVKKVKYRAAIIAIIFVLLLLIWAELAVGVFGTTFAGS